jgi:hypothetical protein
MMEECSDDDDHHHIKWCIVYTANEIMKQGLLLVNYSTCNKLKEQKQKAVSRCSKGTLDPSLL